MLASTGIVLFAVIIAMLEARPLWKEGLKKELWVFSLLLLMGTGLGIAEALNWEIPNPLDGMAIIFKPLSDVMLGLLK